MMQTTSSSTSSSDQRAPDADVRAWRGFTGTFLVAACGALAATASALILLDPYDTGRLTLFKPTGMSDGPPWKVNASRARDPSFNAAIIGNSRTQMLEPARLDAVVGDSFVNLSIPGTGPLEMQLVAQSFLRHNPAPRAMVIGVDEWWCRPAQTPIAVFPDWLYAARTRDYLKGLIRYQTIEQLPQRISLLRGSAAPARADGYWDYTPVYAAMTGGEQAQQRMSGGSDAAVQTENPRNSFPAMQILANMLDAAPATTRIVLMWPPTHVSHQPAPLSPAGQTARQCEAAIKAVTMGRANVSIVNWGGDHDVNHEPANFHDETHYTKPVASRLTDAVAARLASMSPKSVAD